MSSASHGDTKDGDGIGGSAPTIVAAGAAAENSSSHEGTVGAAAEHADAHGDSNSRSSHDAEDGEAVGTPTDTETQREAWDWGGDLAAVFRDLQAQAKDAALVATPAPKAKAKAKAKKIQSEALISKATAAEAQQLRTDNGAPQVKETTAAQLGVVFQVNAAASVPAAAVEPQGARLAIKLPSRRARKGSKKTTAAAAATSSSSTGDDSSQPSSPLDQGWTRGREVLLEQKIAALPKPPVYPDEIQYAEHYRCAQANYKLNPDGYQKPSTRLQLETEFLWRAKYIYLAEPPRFITETRTLKERMYMWKLQLELMGSSAYLVTPARLKWTTASAKYLFVQALINNNHDETGPTSETLELLNDVHTFDCDPEAHIVELKFVRPEERDKWVGVTFKFPYNSITIRETASLATSETTDGLDDTATDMFYPIHLLGRAKMDPTDIHNIANELCGGLPILSIQPIPSGGLQTYEAHEWRITMHSTEAPPNISKVRCLKVTQGTMKFTIGVHQPRLSQRQPCSVCLGIGHFRSQCHNTDKDKAAKIRALFEAEISIPATSGPQAAERPTTVEMHERQMDGVRAILSPELAAKDAAAAAERAAKEKARQEAETAAQAAAEAAAEAARLAMEQALEKAIAKAARVQAEVARKAKKDAQKKQKKQKKQSRGNTTPPSAVTAALGKSKVVSGSKAAPKPATAKSTFDASAFAKKTKVRPPSDDTVRWAGAKADTVGATVSVLTKRDYDAGREEMRGQDQGSALVLSKPVAEESSEPPVRQAKTAATPVVDRTRKPSSRAPQPTGVHGALAPHQRARFNQLTVSPFFQNVEVREGEDAGEAEAEVEFIKLVVASQPQIAIGAVLGSVSMKEVQTPANGSCLLHAMAAMEARRCGPVIDGTDHTEIQWAIKRRGDLSDLIIDNIVPWLASGSLDRHHLSTAYLALATPPGDLVPRVQEHFRQAKALQTVNVSRDFWGGEPELAAYVMWKKEPVYVFDVLPSGETCVQRWAAADKVLEDGSYVERVVRQYPSIERFRVHMGVYKRLKVVPLVMICRHQLDKHQATAHFTAARVPQYRYSQWAGSEDKYDAMRTRLPRLLLEIVVKPLILWQGFEVFPWRLLEGASHVA